MCVDLAASLLPGAPQFQLDTIDVDSDGITLEMSSIQGKPPCPDCGNTAYRVHSGYRRTLADLPWSDLVARIRLFVRRFFCDQPTCPRTTFTERVPALTVPYARRTRRLATVQRDVAAVLGGAAGARLSATLRMPASRSTLLRLLRQLRLLPAKAPRVIGIDDWAKRKGHSYGTIVVDLETHDPIDLLDDRSSETVETWLKAHPTVEVISRDRAGAYASGAVTGAPNAVQVADRWHIVKNLQEAIEQELVQRGARIDRTAMAASLDTPGPSARTGVASNSGELLTEPAETATVAAGILTVPSVQSAMPTLSPGPHARRRADPARQARRTARLAKYTQMEALRDQGVDGRTIARAIGISQRTVVRWGAGAGFPERKPRSGETSSLDPYKATLVDRWQAGCHNATHLWRTIQAEGFAGGYELVANYLAPLRRGEAVSADSANQPSVTSTTSPTCYTARQAAFLLLRRPTELTISEQQDLTRMRKQDDILATIYTLTQDLVATVRERRPERLDAWLDVAATSNFPEIQRFANGICRDYAAVRAALELPWSQGPVEGQITRLKLVKRQMYGRAKLDLLRLRLLRAA
jgi:transposase